MAQAAVLGRAAAQDSAAYLEADLSLSNITSVPGLERVRASAASLPPASLAGRGSLHSPSGHASGGGNGGGAAAGASSRSSGSGGGGANWAAAGAGGGASPGTGLTTATLASLGLVGDAVAKRAPPLYRRAGGTPGGSSGVPHSPVQAPSGATGLLGASGLPPLAGAGRPPVDGFLLDPVFGSQGAAGLAVARRFQGTTSSGVLLNLDEAEHARTSATSKARRVTKSKRRK
jgi:hypothetical protein